MEPRCHVFWLQLWVSVGPRREKELKGDAEADLAASKARPSGLPGLPGRAASRARVRFQTRLWEMEGR